MPETDPDRNRSLLERCLWRHIWIGTGSSTHAHSVRRSNASLSTTSSPREQDFQGLFDQLGQPDVRLSERTTSLSAFGWCCFLSSSWLFCFSRRPPVPWKGNPPPGEGKPTRKLHPNPSSSFGVVMLAPRLCAALPFAPSLPSPRLGGSFLFLRGSCCRSLFLFLPSLGRRQLPCREKGNPGTRNSNPKMERQPRPQQGSFTPSSGVLGFRLWTFFTA